MQVAIPTPFDKTAHNGLEQYVWNEKKNRVDVTYTFNDGSFEGKQVVVKQKGRVNPTSSTGAQWQVLWRWLRLSESPKCAVPNIHSCFHTDVHVGTFTCMLLAAITRASTCEWERQFKHWCMS